MSKCDDKELLSDIAKFYEIMWNRNEKLDDYEIIGTQIINTAVKQYVHNLSGEYTLRDEGNILLEVPLMVTYLDDNKQRRNTLLAVDLLYKEIGYSSRRIRRIKDVVIVQRQINLKGGKPIILDDDEFQKLWQDILDKSDENETLKYLRESVETMRQLGTEILKRIEEI